MFIQKESCHIVIQVWQLSFCKTQKEKILFFREWIFSKEEDAATAPIQDKCSSQA